MVRGQGTRILKSPENWIIEIATVTQSSGTVTWRGQCSLFRRGAATGKTCRHFAGASFRKATSSKSIKEPGFSKWDASSNISFCSANV